VDQSSTRRAEKQSRETQSEPHVFEIAFIDALWMLKEDVIDHVFCSDTLVLVNMT
jgi:hydroxyethylthiazole kinase-like sugar kinase family protein